MSTDIPIGRELLADLASRISIADLRELSRYDARLNETDDTDKHFRPLLKIKETLETQKLDPWYPLEVIELCRWEQPFNQDIKGHTVRAFCCAVLLHAHTDDYSIITSCDSTLGNLIQSLLSIDDRLFEKAEGLFKALLESSLIEPSDKVLVPVAQLMGMLRYQPENVLKEKLEHLLEYEKDNENQNRFIFDKNNEFFAKRDRPQVDNGWRYGSNYIYEYLPNISDPTLRQRLLELCKRLWNPQPEHYALPLPCPD